MWRLWLAGALVLASCGSQPVVRPSYKDVTHSVRTAHWAFSVTYPSNRELTQPEDTNSSAGCTGIQRATLAEPQVADRVRFSAVPKGCQPRNYAPGNGQHGAYRTIADVSQPRDRRDVSTRLGPAVAFNQRYFECTNSCRNWDEAVAIITLTAPVDPEYPTMIVLTERVGDRGAMTALLARLAPA
jgi:hypothetical protein